MNHDQLTKLTKLTKRNIANLEQLATYLESLPKNYKDFHMSTFVGFARPSWASPTKRGSSTNGLQPMTQQVELTLLWKHETDAAVLVEDDRGNDVWLPKSQIDIGSGDEVGTMSDFVIPEWLAIEKGLV